MFIFYHAIIAGFLTFNVDSGKLKTDLYRWEIGMIHVNH